jgi:RNA polymerase-binding transcription factor DksA
MVTPPIAHPRNAEEISISSSRRTRLLGAIENALARVEAGTTAFASIAGREIPRAAKPSLTKVCISCKEKQYSL